MNETEKSLILIRRIDKDDQAQSNVNGKLYYKMIRQDGSFALVKWQDPIPKNGGDLYCAEQLKDLPPVEIECRELLHGDDYHKYDMKFVIQAELVPTPSFASVLRKRTKFTFDDFAQALKDKKSGIQAFLQEVVMKGDLARLIIYSGAEIWVGQHPAVFDWIVVRSIQISDASRKESEEEARCEEFNKYMREEKQRIAELQQMLQIEVENANIESARLDLRMLQKERLLALAKVEYELKQLTISSRREELNLELMEAQTKEKKLRIRKNIQDLEHQAKLAELQYENDRLQILSQKEKTASWLTIHRWLNRKLQKWLTVDTSLDEDSKQRRQRKKHVSYDYVTAALQLCGEAKEKAAKKKLNYERIEVIQGKILASLRNVAQTDPYALCFSIVKQVVYQVILDSTIEKGPGSSAPEFDFEKLLHFLNEIFPIDLTSENLTHSTTEESLEDAADKLSSQIVSVIEKKYQESASLEPPAFPVMEGGKIRFYDPDKKSAVNAEARDFLLRTIMVDHIDKFRLENIRDLTQLQKRQSSILNSRSDVLEKKEDPGKFWTSYVDKAFSVFEEEILNGIFNEVVQDLFRCRILERSPQEPSANQRIRSAYRVRSHHSPFRPRPSSASYRPSDESAKVYGDPEEPSQEWEDKLESEIESKLFEDSDDLTSFVIDEIYSPEAKKDKKLQAFARITLNTLCFVEIARRFAAGKPTLCIFSDDDYADITSRMLKMRHLAHNIITSQSRCADKQEILGRISRRGQVTLVTKVQWKNCTVSGPVIHIRFRENGITRDEPSAKQDHAEAKKSAVKLYNEGVLHYRKAEYVLAAKCFQNAAELGLAEAQFNLGVCYETGKGVPKDYNEAAAWYRKAAVQGHAGAREKLSEWNLKWGPDEQGTSVSIPHRREVPRVGRNDPCPCGSGKKYKNCCGRE